MKWPPTQMSLMRMHWLVWAGVWIIIFLSLIGMDGLPASLIFASIYTVFYALIIHGNANYLLPRLYRKGRIKAYVAAVIVLLSVAGISKGMGVFFIYNNWFAEQKETFRYIYIFNYLVAGVLTYILSFLYRIALDYFTLKRHTEEIIFQKTQAELNLLKSQAQPHFLFNTLNNIYYEAYREAPRTAHLIERLSEIMRYFVDESPKEKVLLSTEIQFLENYMALEKIRIRHGVDIRFIKESCRADDYVPPMLLITFVENIFKHGIDKSSSDNAIDIWLVRSNGSLYFETRNKMPQQPQINGPSGFGLKNLQQRLTLLYGDTYELNTNASGPYFIASLKFPVN
ncbi:sensor histidine kinase [Deminuibacter soli]|uniref:Signal transduction histidine kinase internal region domain-containing protein n=1 Tax=Deminuibacter soli TaxID=2291815 RepID=A0A3E1NJ96_9BACT|nr:histidine kinase [Deminuibacter soli]RFM27993.1 hypothetical protein DXN05_10645 [Deminuibacter soli]